MLLVLLRLAIGWQFYKEGVSHHTDPAWSSEGFLRQAKGPLADLYKSVLPNFHNWNRLMLGPLAEDRSAKTAGTEAEEPTPKAPAAEAKEKETPKKAEKDGKPAAKKPSATTGAAIYDAWLKSATDDWKADAAKFAEFYHFDQKQKDAAGALVAETVHRMKDELEDYEADIQLYRELVTRVQALGSAPGADQIPNEVARLAAARQNPLGERGISGQSSPLATTPAAWQTNAKAIDQLFHDQLRGLLTDQQKEMAALPATDATWLHRIDTAIPWTLMIVGGCLIVGLFTRLAAVVGALFLLSVVCAQPPWLATSELTHTYFQWVEILGLLALATMPVGRWGGLDYFISRCCAGCCGSRSKVVVDPPNSKLPPGVNMPPAMKKHLT